jgi:PhnB protein
MLSSPNKVYKKPKKMALINPYIHFNGNAEEAFTFYKSVFGGAFAKIMRYKDLSSPEYPIAENDEKRIMHIALPIGKNNALMGSDVLEIMGQVTENDNRNTISISAESREEADKLFNGLSEGGKIEMPIADGPFAYFGMFADKYGIQWMVNFAP